MASPNENTDVRKALFTSPGVDINEKIGKKLLCKSFVSVFHFQDHFTHRDHRYLGLLFRLFFSKAHTCTFFFSKLTIIFFVIFLAFLQ